MVRSLENKGVQSMDSKLYGGDRNKYKYPDLQDLETYLFEVLVPVTPQTEFVGSLRERLLVEPESILVQRKADPVQGILLGSAGVLSGVLLLVLGGRAIIALFRGKGYLQQFKNQMQQKRAQSLQTAT
jgi:hypothetical protein